MTLPVCPEGGLTRTRSFPFLAAAALVVTLSLLSCSSSTQPPEDTTPKPYTCTGPLATCLRISSGWTFEGVVLSAGQTGNGGPDPFVLRLDDGRYRLYYAVADRPADPDWWGMVSWISSDGRSFTKEPGYRLEGYTLFGHGIVRNADGSYRMYWLDQQQGNVIRSALSTDGGWTFSADPGTRLTASGTGFETNGIGGGRVIRLNNGQYRMYYTGASDYARGLSALSTNGLDFTREGGIRLDYSQDGSLSTWVHPEDFTAVQTPQGLRVYFIVYGGGSTIIPETALYSVINTSIR